MLETIVPPATKSDSNRTPESAEPLRKDATDALLTYKPVRLLRYLLPRGAICKKTFTLETGSGIAKVKYVLYPYKAYSLGEYYHESKVSTENLEKNARRVLLN